MKVKKLLLVFGLSLGLVACSGGQEREQSEESQPGQTEASDLVSEETEATEESLESSEESEEEKEEVQADQEEYYTYTDSIGREVEIPSKIERLAPSGHMATMMVYSIDPDLFCCLGSRPSEENARFYSEEYMQLPEVGAFYGRNADLNVEALLEADPQIVIDVGQVKGSPEEMAAELDGLQEKIGRPIIVIEAELDSLNEAYLTLGEILDREEACQDLADFSQEAVDMAKEKSARLEEGDKKTVFIGKFESGLATDPQGSIHSEVLDLVGGVNVVEADFDSSADASFEQLMVWDPDVILFGHEAAYERAGQDPSWQGLRAVSEDSYYLIPDEPYNFLSNPPATNRVMGIYWLGNLLYPDLYDYDIVEVMQEYYELFYRYDLSEEEALEMLEESTVKAQGQPVS